MRIRIKTRRAGHSGASQKLPHVSLILYNAIQVAGLLILFPAWTLYLATVSKARAGFREKLGFYDATLKDRLKHRRFPGKRIWFHAVSVGELNAIRTLITDLSETFDIVISTTTRTGYQLARQSFPQLPILYFPYDLPGPIRRAIDTVRPDLMVIAETELWPGFIDRLTRSQGCPLLLINGRLSARSLKGYEWLRLLLRPCLQQITHLYVQSQSDADRFSQLGHLPVEQLTVAGNLKFDLNPTVEPARRATLAHLLNIRPGNTVLTFASTHSGEDGPLVDIFLQLKKDFPELKLILAPRHPERLPEIIRILTTRGVTHTVRSRLSENAPNQEAVVVLDSIGELLTVYSLSTIAVMGGSFVEKGGQNPLEALSQRVPVIFGPHMRNFSEISRLVLEAHAGFQVGSPEDLTDVVTGLLTQPEIYESIAEHGQQLMENNRGAKAIIRKAISSQLSVEPGSPVSPRENPAEPSFR